METTPIHQKLVFINPIAGGRKKDFLRKKIIAMAEKQSGVETLVTNAKGDIARAIQKKGQEQRDIVFVICGGDGTVQEAAAALYRTDIPMMIIPCGSGDGFATNAGFKAMLPGHLISAGSGTRKPVDCYQLNGVTGVNMCGFGFDAEIAHLFAENLGRGLPGYMKLITSKIWSSRERKFTIDDGSKQFEVKTWILGIANGSVMGNGAIVNPGGRIDDGELELYSIRKPKWYQVVPLLIRVFNGSLSRSKLYKAWKGTIFSVQSGSNLAHLDGEPLMAHDGNFKVEISKSALTLMIPKRNEEE